VKILVTGAAGYIGSILVPRLLQTGHEVTAIDNFMYGQTPLLDCCHDRKLKIVRGDARDERLIAEHLKSADAVFPLACLTGAPACDRDPLGARTVNLEAVRCLLDLRSADQRIVFPTTNSGYGMGRDGALCTEETPLAPVSLYGRLKVEAEEVVLGGANTITLRLATVFGVSPRMRLDLLVNDFTYRAVVDGYVVLFESHFKRNYIHVRDVARAFAHCLDHFEVMRGEPYNVGLSDANMSKRELCEEIKKRVPDFYFVDAAVGRDPDRRNYIVSSEKIERTGFWPEFSLGDGIAELVRAAAILRRSTHGNA